MTTGCTPYTPAAEWPDLDGSEGRGPLELQNNGQVLNHQHTFRNDSSDTLGTLAKLIDAANWLKRNHIKSAIKALNPYNGTTQQLLTGSGSSPGTWIESSLVSVASAVDGKAGDVVNVDAAFMLGLHIAGSGLSGCQAKLVIFYSDTSTEEDIDGSEVQYVTVGAGVGSLVNVRYASGGRHVLSESGPFSVYFHIRLANTEYADVMGDGFLRTTHFRVG